MVTHGRAEVDQSYLIGQCVAIGGCCLHKKISKIGDNVAIRAGVVVLSSILSNSVIAGIPARIVKNSVDSICFVN